MKWYRCLSIIILIVVVLSTVGCITINPTPAPSPAPIPAPTPTPSPKQQRIDLEKYMATPDLQPSYTIADLTRAKAELSNFFEEDYYAERLYVSEKYRPHDLAALKRAIVDMNQLPWTYKSSVFDCSEMSAIVQLYLKVAGFDTVMVIGSDPAAQGAGHAWPIVFLQQPTFQAVPVEATSLSIPKATGNVYGAPPNQVVMDYEDYLKSGWVLRDIYEAWVWGSGQGENEFDWWNSYPLSVDELFGKARRVPTPTPTPSPTPTPTPTAGVKWQPRVLITPVSVAGIPPKPASLLASNAEYYALYNTYESWGWDFTYDFESASHPAYLQTYAVYSMGRTLDKNKILYFDRVEGQWKPRTVSLPPGIPSKPASLLASDAEYYGLYLTYKNWGWDFNTSFEKTSEAGRLNNWGWFWIGSGEDENKRLYFDRM